MLLTPTLPFHGCMTSSKPPSRRVHVLNGGKPSPASVSPQFLHSPPQFPPWAPLPLRVLAFSSIPSLALLIPLFPFFLDSLAHTRSFSYHPRRSDSELCLPSPHLPPELQTHVPSYMLDSPAGIFHSTHPHQSLSFCPDLILPVIQARNLESNLTLPFIPSPHQPDSPSNSGVP